MAKAQRKRQARKQPKNDIEQESSPPYTELPDPIVLLLIALYLESQALRNMIMQSDEGIRMAQQLGESAQAIAGPVIREVLGLPPLEDEVEVQSG